MKGNKSKTESANSDDVEMRDQDNSSEEVIDDRRKEHKDFAEKIKKENENFIETQQKSKIERLKFIIKQTELYAHFLVGNSKIIDDSKHKIIGKHSVRKRNSNNALMKSLKELDENNEDIEPTQQITRLYYQPSILTGGKLTYYQLDGLNWLISLYETGLNGILADEMGLGKTIQSIAFMSFLKQYKRKNGYFIVVVPKSTMPNWSRELKLWCPSLNVIYLNPVKEEREESLKRVVERNFDVLITSYEGVNICINTLRKINWECLIIDEAHRIKNERALLSKNVRILNSNFRLLVTGTPLQNNLHELWALLNFLLPELFSSSEDFDEWFGMTNSTEGEDQEDQEERNAEIVKQLHKILKPFLLRRTKNEVEKTLPPKKEIHIKVGLTETQKNIYKKLLTSSLLNESKTVYKNIIMQLRKACNHPYLFDGVEDQTLPELGDHIVLNSSKMRILDKLLKKLKVRGSQVLIFSQMTRMLDIIEDYCIFSDYKFCRIDGNTSLEDREIQIAEFTQPKSDIFIFLLSTRAGGLGLNLMTADTVVLYDSDWNPQVDLQAMDRVHRIGQTKPVLVYRMICENTIEEKIIERQAMRLKLDSLIIQQGRIAKGNDNFSKEEMKEMIQYGADAIFKAGDDFKDEDIDIILERGEKNTNSFYEEAEKQAMNKSNLLINMSFQTSDLYKFENEDYLKKRKEESERVLSMAIAEEFENEHRLNRRDRNLKQLNYNIDQNFDQLLSTNKNIKKKGRLAKVPYHFLFKNRDRLVELKQKQINAYVENSIKIPEKFDENFSINDYLTEDECKELEDIVSTGFLNWDRKEYETFINILERYGKNCYDILVPELPNKTIDEVKQYSDAFWERNQDLPEGPRVQRNIERREKIEKQKELATLLLSKKVEQCDDNYEDMRIIYPSNSNRTSEFTAEEDQFIIYLAFKNGYGNWDDIVKDIRLSDDFMFNYYLKSRDRTEIQKRVDYLFPNVDVMRNNSSVSGSNLNKIKGDAMIIDNY